MPTTQEYFLAALKHTLEARKMTQRQLAGLSGIAPQTISNIVTETQPAGLNNQEKIAQACGYELVDFLIMGRDLLCGTEQSGKMSPREAATVVNELLEHLSAAE